MNLRPYTRGLVLMVASSLLFSAMAISLRCASEISFLKTSFVRFVVGIAIVLAPAAFGLTKLRFVNWKALVVRGFVGGAGVIVYFFSITTLGLAKGTVFFFTYPVFAAILSPILIKEKTRPITWLAVAIALAGVLLLGGANRDVPFWYNIIALTSGASGGLVAVTIRELRKTDSATAIYFAQSAFGLLLLIPMLAWANLQPLDVATSMWPVLLAVGIFASGGQLLMNHAYTFLPAAEGSLIGLATPLVNVFIGVAFFHEKLGPTGFLGVACVLSACLLLFLKARPIEEPPP